MHDLQQEKSLLTNAPPAWENPFLGQNAETKKKDKTISNPNVEDER